MLDTKHVPVIRTVEGRMDEAQCSLKDETEQENLDRQTVHEYLPMDVYIDPKTMEEHFQALSNRSR